MKAVFREGYKMKNYLKINEGMVRAALLVIIGLKKLDL